MSQFGRFYRSTTFGESHSAQVGVIVEGFPSNIDVDIEYIQAQLTRRRPGQSSLTTQRNEKDKVTIQSGIENGKSLGTPICMTVNNEDYIKKDYSQMLDVPRPGHADYTYFKKYGVKAESGGGRSSARETIGRVCSGALADIYLLKKHNIQISAFVSAVGSIKIPKQEQIEYFKLNRQQIDEQSTYQIFQTNENNISSEIMTSIFKNQGKYYDQEGFIIENQEQIQKLDRQFEENLDKINVVNVRCPHIKYAIKMIQQIQKVKDQKDSIGGQITCVIKNVPVGLGEPCFDKIEALLAHAMLSIPATKGFEIGSGFEGTEMQGSQHNDTFKYDKKNENNNEDKQNLNPNLQFSSNNAGGTLGGISSGEDIYFTVAFKPVSTIGKPQETCDMQGNKTILEAKGRHDPCVLPRAPPIVEAMSSMVIMDMLQAQKININN